MYIVLPVWVFTNSEKLRWHSTRWMVDAICMYAVYSHTKNSCRAAMGINVQSLVQPTSQEISKNLNLKSGWNHSRWMYSWNYPFMPNVGNHYEKLWVGQIPREISPDTCSWASLLPLLASPFQYYGYWTKKGLKATIMQARYIQWMWISHLKLLTCYTFVSRNFISKSGEFNVT